ncbi:MAG: arsenic efflux protein [Candidatus Moranbacteria bacterium]|nr:arsenic efflux protein [Candidatus Moranbacteria bacterium]
MYDIFLDALIDSAKTIPLLLVVYIGIELMEYAYAQKIVESIRKAGSAGPVIGAIAGILPQCGFSVFATALYNQRLVTIGTLMAVYLSTSDEAIPVILSHSDRLPIIVPFIVTKVVIALIFGYMLDVVYRKSRKRTFAHVEAYDHGHDDPNHSHRDVLRENACCGHHVEVSERGFHLNAIIFHPLNHAVKIFIFIFVTTFAINLAFFRLGDAALMKIFLNNGFFQPFVAALFGLIPNCAVSVGITELYLRGVLTYGSTIAGLCASGGLGILILFKEEKAKLEAVKIVGMLFGISVVAGLFVQYVLRF